MIKSASGKDYNIEILNPDYEARITEEDLQKFMNIK
jgi:hypothetical protein